jgi:hypothetical protein
MHVLQGRRDSRWMCFSGNRFDLKYVESIRESKWLQNQTTPPTQEARMHQLKMSRSSNAQVTLE